MSSARTIPKCEFGKKGGARCDLLWADRRAKPGTIRWNRVIDRDLCATCGAEVRRRHTAVKR